MSHVLRPRQRLQLALLCLAQFMLVLDVVVVNVALPSIRADLGLADARLPLVGVAYTLTFGALLIVFGRAGDLFGRRRLLTAGLAVFGLASLAIGVAGSGWLLFAGRAAQGVGAAMVSPVALALVLATFTDDAARNRAMGVWGAVGSAGAIAGQVVGGALVTTVGWRSIFLVNVPIAVAVVLGVLRTVTDPHERAGGQRLDVPGAALLTGSLAAVIVALVRIAEHGLDSLGAGIAGAAVAGLWRLWRVEGRHPQPLLDRALVADRAVRVGNAVLAVNAAVLTAALFFTTLYLQLVLGMSALAVGLAFAPITVVVLVVSPLAGRAVSRFGVRPLLAAGALAGVAGLLWLARVPADGAYLADVMPGLALLAVMGGLSYAPSYIAGTAGVGPDRQGLASGLLNTAQELGAAIGLAALSAVALATAGSAASTSTYRAGFLAAAAAALAVFGLAVRVPARLGRTDRAAPAPVEASAVPQLTGAGR